MKGRGWWARTCSSTRDARPGARGTPATAETWDFRWVDVTDEESVTELVDAAVDFGGRVDGVVNAAGVAGGGPVHMLPKDEWDRVIGVNLTGTYLVAKHVIKRCWPSRPEESRGVLWSPWPASRASRARRAAAPTAHPRAGSSCSPKAWPSTMPGGASG